ncbi:MAG: hypothetical protein QOH93_3166 [Chloroflexia bacterium]|jgi:hypothetical protein|nr:hypothetical protein [Chloroflexia bacterium]
MPKKLITLRVTDETDRQLEELTTLLGATRTEVMIYATERLYREVKDRSAPADTSADTPTEASTPGEPPAIPQPAGTSE